jgi:methylenetetrahydrofolate dehydrogenase (NADP+)/methenyltetrahydrofolate cyclohydrolase
MEILDGKTVAQAVKNDLKIKIAELIAEGQTPPHLVAILIGNNGASETYVASKVKNCEEIGMKSTLHRLDTHTSEAELIRLIEKLNNDRSVHGILVQLPLPPHIDEQKITPLIHPLKDVDGFSPNNMGNLTLGLPCFIPATPYGILLMLDYYKIETKGKHAVVIGRSNIVGRPMSILLSQNRAHGDCTVTVCHSRTKNLNAICKDADILIAALGIPGFVKSDMVKPGAIVIDVGITRVQDSTKKSGFSIKGDVDFDKVSPLCSYITPVPGGVGLMTIGALLLNTYQAALKQNSQPA